MRQRERKRKGGREREGWLEVVRPVTLILIYEWAVFILLIGVKDDTTLNTYDSFLFHFWHSQSKKHVPRDPFSFLCLSVCPRLLLSDCVCAPASVSHIISVLKQASFHLFTSFSPSPLSYCQARTCRLISISFFPVSLSLSFSLTHSFTLCLFYITHWVVFFSLSLFFGHFFPALSYPLLQLCLFLTNRTPALSHSAFSLLKVTWRFKTDFSDPFQVRAA